MSAAQRVLIADDDPPVRSAVARLLRSEGLDVLETGDGEDALRLFREERPDLVLLDVVMPGRDGFEICAQLKANPSTALTPVVMLTGLTEVEDRVRGIEAGADDFLSKPFDRTELLARVRSALKTKRYTDELEDAEAVLFTLARSIEGKDPYTEGHCERLATTAAELGARMGLSHDDLTALRRAGVVHDIGKVAVPDALLMKAGPLSAEEWDIMRRHPATGEAICRPLRSFSRVLPIIRHHHEKLDGSGYPDGLVGDEIPVTARVLQVVDIFDALTTRRPYKPAFPIDRALEVLDAEVRRGWWDPEIHEAFLAWLAERGRPTASAS
ncbi:MAG: response regulator [Gemmatimonadota bacterium]|nr:response regulator [Gemmatimonadota bacterium]MDH3367864.1 response regulator [Gemmatimonadota bacterium]MDH3479602.1 response regulator [Gemmatimonadota bacterium]MDH5548337.1 response regulator [Gemmatimonadota bacterium]